MTGGPRHLAADVVDRLQLAASETDSAVELRYLVLSILDDAIRDLIVVDPVSRGIKNLGFFISHGLNLYLDSVND